MAPVLRCKVVTRVTGTVLHRDPLSKEGSGEFDGRTARQWLQSAIDYCLWRARNGWRRASDPHQRWNPDRLWYLDGVRTLTGVLLNPQANQPQIALPVLNPAPAPLPGELAFRTFKRVHLAASLIRESDGRYTDFRLLSHLPKNKLAHMLAELRFGAAREERLMSA